MAPETTAGTPAATETRAASAGTPADAGEAQAAQAPSDVTIDVTRLRVAIARLSRRLRRHELAGLTPTQLAALSTVERSGPLRLGDLAAAEGIAPSTLTRLVSVLEEFGYVQRDPDPRDARASMLAITPKGHDVLESLREESTLLLTKSLTTLTTEQRAALSSALPVLEQLADSDPAAAATRPR